VKVSIHFCYPEKKENIKKLVVFLHGYGCAGKNWLELAKFFETTVPDALFAAPDGIEPWEINPAQGFQWFGLRNMAFLHLKDDMDLSIQNIRRGLDKSGPVVAHNIQTLANSFGIAAKDITLMGFSQGAMMALELMYLIPGLGRVVAYSGAFVPPENAQEQKISTKVLLVHGDADNVVSYKNLIDAKNAMESLKINAEYHTCHDLGHSISTEGIQVSNDFIKQYPT